MIKVHLKGINKVRKRLANGTLKVFYYHRATGMRLPGEPGSPEFISAYHAAQETIKSRDRNEGTLKALIQRYMESDAYTQLSKRTRSDYLKQTRKIEEKFGDLPIPALNDARVRSDFLDWRDKLAKRSKRQADYALTVLGIILSWSVDRGLIEANHAYRPKRKYKSDRSNKIWTQANVEAFVAKAPKELVLALILGRDTGQRQGDLLRLTWTAYDGEYIRLTQSKTGAQVEIPLTRAVKRSLERLKKRRSKNSIQSATILARNDGQPWKQDHFRHAWRKVTLEAGLDGLTFSDLRGTAVTRLADAGCTTPEICAITGHSLASANVILQHYLARTRTQADAAILKLENARRTKTANQAANRKVKGGGGKS